MRKCCYACSNSNFINIKISVMIIQVFKKAVFIIGMFIIIITYSDCKKNAGEDYQPLVDSPRISSPPMKAGWTALVLPQGEFSVGLGQVGWFSGDNFLLGIKNDLFAISSKGSVWRYNVASDWSRVGSFPEDMPE